MCGHSYTYSDSGITLAVGYHQRSGISYRECLMKNRYIGRTFIMPDQSMRETAVRLKMNTIRPNIEGHDLVLVDDSIVRGTTSRRIVNMVRKAGAKSVHCPHRQSAHSCAMLSWHRYGKPRRADSGLQDSCRGGSRDPKLTH